MATCWGGSAQQLRQLGEVRRHPLPSAPILVGDPSRPLLWQEVDTLLREQITTATGHRLPIRAACVDSGGHHALRVYDFVRDKGNRSIWAIKGSSMPGVPPWPRKPSRVNKGKVALYVIGTDALKDAFAARLRIEQPGAGYCHFPVGRGQSAH